MLCFVDAENSNFIIWRKMKAETGNLVFFNETITSTSTSLLVDVVILVEQDPLKKIIKTIGWVNENEGRARCLKCKRYP